MGTQEFCISTDKHIYFYSVEDDGMTKLQNVMQNYMKCTQIMFGKSKKSAITFNANEKSFEIYQRKFLHNLRVCANSTNMVGAKAIEIITMDQIFVTNIDCIDIYNSTYFRKVGSIPIPLLPTETREPNEIIGIQKSQDEKFLAIVTGKNLIMNQQKQNQLFIFKRQEKLADGEESHHHEEDMHGFDEDEIHQNCNQEFVLHKRILVRDIPIFNKVCMNFMFKNPKADEEYSTLIFVKQKQIFAINYEKESMWIIYEFAKELQC